MNKKIIAMRKSLLLIGFCALAICASAQNTALKVQSNGKIAIQTNSTALSPISINAAGNASDYIYCKTLEKNGMYVYADGDEESNNLYGGRFFATSAGFGTGLSGTADSCDYRAIGLSGYARNSDDSFGVMGAAYNGPTSIGVHGSFNSPNSSHACAAIYGTIYGDYGTGLNVGDRYAGFFRGDVKITGNLVYGRALLGESASESSSSGGGLSLRGASVASSLSGLNVTTYQKERPETPEITETVYDGIDGKMAQRGEEPEPDIMDEQYYGKTHYALDADRLEEAFPDLVYVNKDGSKAINYVEMIPLLVQSINELSAEIEVLKGQSLEGTAKKTRSATDRNVSYPSQNKLYQNTPNPFKEQTIIRFSLADDVQDAAICIFDMTGKAIKKLPVSSGMESVSIGGYELGEGMFLYSLVVNGQEIDTKRMIITK